MSWSPLDFARFDIRTGCVASRAGRCRCSDLQLEYETGLRDGRTLAVQCLRRDRASSTVRSVDRLDGTDERHSGDDGKIRTDESTGRPREGSNGYRPKCDRRPRTAHRRDAALRDGDAPRSERLVRTALCSRGDVDRFLRSNSRGRCQCKHLSQEVRLRSANRRTETTICRRVVKPHSSSAGVLSAA